MADKVARLIERQGGVDAIEEQPAPAPLGGLFDQVLDNGSTDSASACGLIDAEVV